MSAHSRLTVSDLSPDQLEVYTAVMSWLNRSTSVKPVLSLAGYAGSGKTTVTSVIAHEMLKLGPIAFACFTGKASSVLGRKLKAAGIHTVNRVSRKMLLGPTPYCGTIHGLIYAPCDGCMVETTYEHTMGSKCIAPGATGAATPTDEGVSEALVDAVVRGEDPLSFLPTVSDEVCLACNPPPPVKKEGPCSKCHGERFFRRSGLDRNYKFLVIDEASMIDDNMLRDLLSYNIPILAVGDHGQLPPIKGVGSLMKTPDLRLEKIHRQAEGNPIIALSAQIRTTGDFTEDLADGEHLQFMSKRDFGKWIQGRFPAERLGLDPASSEGILGTVLISWTNKQRVALNQQVREALGTANTSPKRGEVMICLKNAAPIYNGMRGVVGYDAVSAGNARCPQWKTDIDFVEDGVKGENVMMADAQIFAEKTIDYDAARELGVSFNQLGSLYDFGYALTCHKMQASQAYEVAVLVDGLRAMDREQRTRWMYSAVTRAEKKLLVVM